MRHHGDRFMQHQGRGDFSQGSNLQQLPEPTIARYEDFSGGFDARTNRENVPQNSSYDCLDVRVTSRNEVMRLPGVLQTDVLGYDVEQLILHPALSSTAELVMFDAPFMGVKNQSGTNWLNVGLPKSTYSYSWALYGEQLVFSNRSGKVRVKQPNDFNLRQLQNAPSGVTLFVFAGRLFVGGAMVEGNYEPLALSWNDTSGDLDGWDINQGAGTEFLLDNATTGDYIITGRSMGLHLAAVFLRRSIWVGRFSGVAAAPAAWEPRVSGIGALNSKVVQVTNKGVIFLSDSGVFIFDGNEAQHISAQIDAELLPLDSEDECCYSSAYNPNNKTYLLFTATGTWVYDIEYNRWFRSSLKARSAALFPTQEAPYVWDELTGTWDAQELSWDDFQAKPIDAGVMYYLSATAPTLLGKEDLVTEGYFGQLQDAYWACPRQEGPEFDFLFTHQMVVFEYRGSGSASLYLSDIQGDLELVDTVTLLDTTPPRTKRRSFIHTGQGVALKFTLGGVARVGKFELRSLVRQQRFDLPDEEVLPPPVEDPGPPPLPPPYCCPYLSVAPLGPRFSDGLCQYNSVANVFASAGNGSLSNAYKYETISPTAPPDWVDSLTGTSAFNGHFTLRQKWLGDIYHDPIEFNRALRPIDLPDGRAFAMLRFRLSGSFKDDFYIGDELQLLEIQLPDNARVAARVCLIHYTETRDPTNPGVPVPSELLFQVQFGRTGANFANRFDTPPYPAFREVPVGVDIDGQWVDIAVFISRDSEGNVRYSFSADIAAADGANIGTLGLTAVEATASAPMNGYIKLFRGDYGGLGQQTGLQWNLDYGGYEISGAAYNSGVFSRASLYTTANPNACFTLSEVTTIPADVPAAVCRDALAPLLSPAPRVGAIEDDEFCWWLNGQELRDSMAISTSPMYQSVIPARRGTDPATGLYLIDIAKYNPGTLTEDPYCVTRAFGSVYRVNATFPAYMNGYTFGQSRYGIDEGFWCCMEKVRCSTMEHYQGVFDNLHGGTLGPETLTYGEYPLAPEVPFGQTNPKYWIASFASWTINGQQFFFGPTNNGAGYGLSASWDTVNANTQSPPVNASYDEETVETDYLFKVKPGPAGGNKLITTVYRRPSGTVPWTLLGSWTNTRAPSGSPFWDVASGIPSWVQFAAGVGEAHRNKRVQDLPTSDLGYADSWHYQLVSYSRRTLIPAIGANNPYGVP